MRVDFSKSFFGHSIEQLSYQIIESYFNKQQEETDKIEYKSFYNSETGSFKEKEKAILKTICGLLNSEGGIIVWGAPVGKKIEGQKEKVFEGELSPLDRKIEKDSFVSKVSNSITPTPDGINFICLEHQGQHLCIIEVQKSDYSPHQFQSIYYMRLDGQTKKAPHHFIEALFRKVTYPKLAGYIKPEAFTKSKENPDEMYFRFSMYILNLSKLQNEHELYFRIITSGGKLYSYIKAGYEEKIRDYQAGGKIISKENAKATIYYNEVYSISDTVVINSKELEALNYKLELMLYFGGKQSPLLMSEYIFKLDNIDISNFSSTIFSMHENVYAHEKGFSDIENEILKLLGR